MIVGWYYGTGPNALSPAEVHQGIVAIREQYEAALEAGEHLGAEGSREKEIARHLGRTTRVILNGELIAELAKSEGVSTTAVNARIKYTLQRLRSLNT